MQTNADTELDSTDLDARQYAVHRQLLGVGDIVLVGGDRALYAPTYPNGHPPSVWTTLVFDCDCEAHVEVGLDEDCPYCRRPALAVGALGLPVWWAGRHCPDGINRAAQVARTHNATQWYLRLPGIEYMIAKVPHAKQANDRALTYMTAMSAADMLGCTIELYDVQHRLISRRKPRG